MQLAHNTDCGDDEMVLGLATVRKEAYMICSTVRFFVSRRIPETIAPKITKKNLGPSSAHFGVASRSGHDAIPAAHR